LSFKFRDASRQASDPPAPPIEQSPDAGRRRSEIGLGNRWRSTHASCKDTEFPIPMLARGVNDYTSSLVDADDRSSHAAVSRAGRITNKYPHTQSNRINKTDVGVTNDILTAAPKIAAQVYRMPIANNRMLSKAFEEQKRTIGVDLLSRLFSATGR